MRCLLYARVSTERQAERDLSIPAQLQIMQEFAKKQGWLVSGHYVDEGESARTTDRPELKRLLHYCQKRRDVNIVLVHKIDRLARNVVDYATIKAVLKRRGIRLVSVVENFDDGPVGQLMENIIASISEWYSANLGEEIRKGARTKLQRGEWPGRPPVGYLSTRENGKVVHREDPAVGPIIRDAFERYSTGQYSLHEVAEEAAERGLRTRRGRPYSEQMMKGLLSRRFFIGKMVWNGREYRGKHPPIVPASLFYRVQEVLKERHVDTGEKGKLYFLLRGVVRCRTCGQRLTAERHPRGTYYRCPPQIRCEAPYIPVKLLDGQLVALYERLQPPKDLLELIKAEVIDIAEERRKAAAGELARLRRVVTAIEAKEVKIADELVGGRLARDLYEKLSQRYRDERRAAEARIAELDVDFRDPLDFFDKCLAVAGTFRLLHARFTDKKRKLLVRVLFKQIDVEDHQIVGVTLNPPFSFFLADQLRRLFEGSSPVGTHKDIFEQLVRFSLSPEYEEMKALVAAVGEGTRWAGDEVAA